MQASPSRLARTKAALPWPAKAVAKMVLARLPVPYRWWKKLSLFEHGRMDDPGYVLGVVREHVAALGRPLEGATCLELGPGDSLASALVLAALGAGRILLVDVGPFATVDLGAYARLAAGLREQGLPVPTVETAGSVPAMLDRLHATYLSDGLASLRGIASASVHLVWSHAVLEHVRRAQVADTLAELRRVSAADGVSSHRIDLRDHLAESLNNLRFPRALWESRLIAGSGFYTNRMRHPDWLAAFATAGFEVVTDEPQRWPVIPLDRRRLAGEFRGLPDPDLRVLDVRIVARPG
ncbi:MAG TPA: class I SAM-dependent methyltransferase [Mycobacteriales bacterium]|nr:class I SAM-dependent methyltransferase [Mycobacteriales bacterium]